MKTKTNILIAGLSLLLIGMMFAIPEVLSFNYLSHIEDIYSFKSYTYVYQIKDDKKIYFEGVDIIYDDTLNNEILINTSYYDGLIDNVSVKAKSNNHNIRMEISVDYKFDVYRLDETYNSIIFDLKNKYVFDYKKLLIPTTTIRVNQKYKDYIVIE